MVALGGDDVSLAALRFQADGFGVNSFDAVNLCSVLSGGWINRGISAILEHAAGAKVRSCLAAEGLPVGSELMLIAEAELGGPAGVGTMLDLRAVVGAFGKVRNVTGLQVLARCEVLAAAVAPADLLKGVVMARCAEGGFAFSVDAATEMESQIVGGDFAKGAPSLRLTVITRSASPARAPGCLLEGNDLHVLSPVWSVVGAEFREDVPGASGLAEPGKDVGEAVAVGIGVGVGHGVGGEHDVQPAFVRAARCGFHLDAGGNSRQNDLSDIAFGEYVGQLGVLEGTPTAFGDADIAVLGVEVIERVYPVLVSVP
nr:hypothetical protein [Mycobacterium sp. E796]